MGEDGRPVMLRQLRPQFEIDVGSPILDVSVIDEIGCLVIATQKDGVLVYSLDGNHQFLLGVNPFAESSESSGSSSNTEFCRKATILVGDSRDDNNNNIGNDAN